MFEEIQLISWSRERKDKGNCQKLKKKKRPPSARRRPAVGLTYF
jgi:hypothetical protein